MFSMMDQIILRVEDMSCGHCEIAIQDAVRKLSGIKKVKSGKCEKKLLLNMIF